MRISLWACDRCGKQTDRPIKVTFKQQHKWNESANAETKDLCDKCFQEFIDFLEGGETDE